MLVSIGRDGQLRTSLYDKRDNFKFHITNFPFLSSKIPSSPAYGVFISQLIRYARACFWRGRFILRAVRLSNKLLGQGYVEERLKWSLKKFYCRYGDLAKQYEAPLPNITRHSDDHIQSDRTLHPFLPPMRTPGVQVENTSSVSPACRKRRLKGHRYVAIVAYTAYNNNLT